MATTDFSPLFSGFDFLQNLMKGAGSSLPGVSQWVTPTLDPEELDRRIQELKTVQFWLEQNAKMLATTIQTLEVQRMTLTTLKAMNVQAADLAEAFRVRQTDAFASINPGAGDDPPQGDPAPAKGAAAAAPAPKPSNRFTDDTASTPPQDAATAPEAPASLVDPMQWWGSLTQQFSQIASQALSDGQVAQAMNEASQKAGAMAGQMMQTAQALGAALKTSASDAAGSEAAKPPPKPKAARATSAKPGAKSSRTVSPKSATQNAASTAAKAAAPAPAPGKAKSTAKPATKASRGATAEAPAASRSARKR